MKISEALLESMSMIDEQYLQSSEAEMKKTFSWKPALSFAAVFALIMAVVFAPQYMNLQTKSSSDSMNMAAEMEEEKDMADALAPETFAVLYDQELIDSLDALGDNDQIKVVIETAAVTYGDEGKSAQSVTENSPEEQAAEVRTMTKKEILSFEGEEGITYIFHLYKADEMD